jgi:membrane-bound serine protease (ClpP class)
MRPIGAVTGRESRGPISPALRGCAAGAILLALLVFSQAAAAAQAVVLEVDGVIGPALADYVTREIRAADPSETRAVILRMNTPGGLDTSMREIIRAILASPVPVITYVAPSGARAASAGTYIAYASAIAAMAPGTNLGAATPIQIGGLPQLPGRNPAPGQGDRGEEANKEANKTGAANEPADTESRKAINDAVAYIRSLAELNGRNAEWAADAVRSAVSLPASEALKLHVIDVIADDLADLLAKIDGRTVKAGGKSVRLATAGIAVVDEPPGWRTELLAAITNPNVAFILMLLGIYGLIFEFLSPGSVAPGTIGAISLLVGLYALNLLPINYAGVGLLVLGIGLMIAEAHIGSFGVIGIGGIAAFVIGAIVMFRSGAPGATLSPWMIAAATLATAAFFLLVIALLLRSRRRPVVTGKEALVGAEGEVVTWPGEEGRVRVAGEIWRARALKPLPPKARVRVVDRDGLVLIVESA